MAKLLIVDDENDVREFASHFFQKRKIDTITASSGEEALTLLGDKKPDLILLDIKMGGMDGVETLRHIKGLDQDARVIMVTGKKPEEENALERCRQLGALEYIHKPLILDELERIVMSLLPHT